MDGYIRGFIMEERATKTLIITQDLAIFFFETKRRRRFSSFPE